MSMGGSTVSTSCTVVSPAVTWSAAEMRSGRMPSVSAAWPKPLRSSWAEIMPRSRVDSFIIS